MLTSCAEDFVTWADVFPPGEEDVNGVRVLRFAAAAGRDPSFHPFSAALLADPDRASLEDAEQWIDLQGPVVPELVAAALHSAPMPSSSIPTSTTRRCGSSTGRGRPPSSHPAAHDEPALRLPVFPRVFGAADGLVFQTAAERELVQRMFPVATHRQLLLGLGVDDPGTARRLGVDARRGRQPTQPGVRPERDDDPYLLCLGRVDRHKGTSLLADLFSAYKERHPGPLRLVLAGPVVDLPDRASGHRRGRPGVRRHKWPCSRGPWLWFPRHRGRRSPWWWPKPGAPGPRWWSTPAVPPPSSTAADPAGD